MQPVEALVTSRGSPDAAAWTGRPAQYELDAPRDEDDDDADGDDDEDGADGEDGVAAAADPEERRRRPRLR